MTSFKLLCLKRWNILHDYVFLTSSIFITIFIDTKLWYYNFVKHKRNVLPSSKTALKFNFLNLKNKKRLKFSFIRRKNYVLSNYLVTNILSWAFGIFYIRFSQIVRFDWGIEGRITRKFADATFWFSFWPFDFFLAFEFFDFLTFYFIILENLKFLFKLKQALRH